MKKLFLFITTIGMLVSEAFGSASLRLPPLAEGAITSKSMITAQSRAGTLRTTQQISSPATNPHITTPVSSFGTYARQPVSKNIKSLSTSKLKNTTTQELNKIDSRIEELQSKLDAAEATQNTIITESDIKENIESVTYTKEEIEELIAELNKKIPKVDDRGNLNLTDPNGNLVVVHLGDVVIGDDNTIIVDGNLSTTSTHPIQNKVVTNALNEKQDKSTNLSFGNANGSWTPVAIGSDYIELYTNAAGAKEFRIKPTMIATNLENMENEDQLITAGAVQEAIAALTTNSGGGIQPSPYFNLINLQTRHGGLVQRYTYETNASESEILDFALNVCGGNFSDRWCTLYESDGHTFKIVKRQEGHVLEDTTTTTNTQSGQGYGIMLDYSVNLPEGQTPEAYASTQLCANRTGTCYMFSSFYLGSNGYNINDTLEPLYFIGIYQE